MFEVRCASLRLSVIISLDLVSTLYLYDYERSRNILVLIVHKLITSEVCYAVRQKTRSGEGAMT